MHCCRYFTLLPHALCCLLSRLPLLSQVINAESSESGLQFCCTIFLSCTRCRELLLTKSVCMNVCVGTACNYVAIGSACWHLWHIYADLCASQHFLCWNFLIYFLLFVHIIFFVVDFWSHCEFVVFLFNFRLFFVYLFEAANDMRLVWVACCRLRCRGSFSNVCGFLPLSWVLQVLCALFLLPRMASLMTSAFNVWQLATQCQRLFASCFRAEPQIPHIAHVTVCRLVYAYEKFVVETHLTWRKILCDYEISSVSDDDVCGIQYDNVKVQFTFVPDYGIKWDSQSCLNRVSVQFII